MNKKGITIAGAFALAIVIGMFGMRGIGTGVQATNSDADFQISGTKLVSYKGTSKSVAIPSTVTEIGNQAFEQNTTVNMVTIPYTVTKIGYRAFSECTNLKNIDIPDSVTSIGPGAFYNCTGLKEVNIGEGVSSLGSGAFAGCSLLEKVAIDSDNPYLVYYAGALYNGDMSMLYQVFAGRTGDNYVMPKTVENIDTYAFWQCKNLKNVLVSSKVKDIPAYAMTNMSSVENVVLCAGTTNISKKAFADNDALKQVVVPVSVSNIDDTAFDKCPNVNIVTESGTTAEKYAKDHKISYSGKAKLSTSFKDSKADELIPDEIKNTNQDKEETKQEESSNQTEQQASEQQSDTSREEESNVEEPSSENTNTNYGTESPLNSPESSDVVGKTVVVNGQAIVLLNNRTQKVYGSEKKATEDTKEDTTDEKNESESVEQTEVSTEQAKDKDVETDKDNSNQMKESEVSQESSSDHAADASESVIAERAYYKNSDLTRITIPETVTNVGKLSFARTGLVSITIPDGVKTIDYGAFYDCQELSKVNISDKVENIEAKAFAKTPWLENWLKGDGTDDPYLIVGDGILLAYRGSEENVILPDTIKQIGAEAFKDHTEIVTVNVPKTVTKIGAKAFSGCSSLEGLKGCRGLKAIVVGAFNGTNVTEETYQID